MPHHDDPVTRIMTAPQSSPSIRIAGAAIVGRRDEQQDCHAWTMLSESPPHLVAALADGMGGEVGGCVASELAIDAALAGYRDAHGAVGERLSAALTRANDAIARRIKSDPSLDGMGCTLVVLALAPDGLRWISVGDSPLWHLRDGRLRRLNEDHSMRPTLALMVENGRMSAEEAARDPQRNALRSCVVGSEIDMVDGPSDPLTLAPGDIVILASDGLQTLSDDDIAKQLLAVRRREPESRVAALLAAVEARNHPRQDNTSVVAVFVDGARGMHGGVLARLMSAFGR